ncbi:unnamed protein product [Brassica napus]|uniref:(rape) hypothetical protein n=1 Tax=Brassica napus TaxID=3708 RepID=A0A816P0B1_BRANA|nr:unnamed protein product [Brassica napus]
MEKKLFEIMMKKKLSFKLFEDFEANCGRSNLSVRTYFASKISDVVQLISVQYVTERPVLHGAGVATIERVLVYFQPKEGHVMNVLWDQATNKFTENSVKLQISCHAFSDNSQHQTYLRVATLDLKEFRQPSDIFLIS